MLFALLTNVVSPHQLPLAYEIVNIIGKQNFRYIFTDIHDQDHESLNWDDKVPQWCIPITNPEANEWLENSDVLLSGLRNFKLFEKRAQNGLKNFYMSERWFKPPLGIYRLFHPRYFIYAYKLWRLVKDNKIIPLPIGIHAAEDFSRLFRIYSGHLSYLFIIPKLDFDNKPCGNIYKLYDNNKNIKSKCKYFLEQIKIWGYFVDRSKIESDSRIDKGDHKELRLLWVGRLLKLKRVDTIINAVIQYQNRVNTNILLNIYGSGPEENKLKEMAQKHNDIIKFYPPVSITEVRRIMHEHDVYVFGSNAYEGWGAVISEALEEGMIVISSREAGAAATMLPEECLYDSGDVNGILQKLKNLPPKVPIGNWTAKFAANALCSLAES